MPIYEIQDPNSDRIFEIDSPTEPTPEQLSTVVSQFKPQPDPEVISNAISTFDPNDEDAEPKAQGIVQATLGNDGQAYLGKDTEVKPQEVVAKLDEMIQQKPDGDYEWYEKALMLSLPAGLGLPTYLWKTTTRRAELEQKAKLQTERKAFEKGIQEQKTAKAISGEDVPFQKVYVEENYFGQRIDKLMRQGYNDLEATAIARAEESRIESFLEVRDFMMGKVPVAVRPQVQVLYDALETTAKVMQTNLLSSARGVVGLAGRLVDDGAVGDVLAWSELGNQMQRWADEPTLLEDAWNRLDVKRLKDLEKVEADGNVAFQVAKQVSIFGEKIKTSAANMALNLAVLNVVSGKGYAQAANPLDGIKAFSKATTIQAGKMALYNAVKTPGDYTERGKVGLVSGLYLMTPILAGYVGGATNSRSVATILDVIQNMSVTEISSAGYSSAIKRGLEGDGTPFEKMIRVVQNVAHEAVADGVFSLKTMPIYEKGKSPYQHDRAYNRIKVNAEARVAEIKDKIQRGEEITKQEQGFLNVAKNSSDEAKQIVGQVLANDSVAQKTFEPQTREPVRDVNEFKEEEAVKELSEDKQGLSKEHINRLTTLLKREEIGKGEKVTFMENRQLAVDYGMDNEAEHVAMLAVEKNRRINDVEIAGMVLKTAQLMNDRDAIFEKIAQNIKDGDKASLSFNEKNLEQIDDSLYTIALGARKEGAERGRNLNMLKFLIDRKDFSASAIMADFAKKKGGELTPQEKRQAADWATKLTKQQELVDERIAEEEAAERKMVEGLIAETMPEEVYTPQQRAERAKKGDKLIKQAVADLKKLGMGRTYEVFSSTYQLTADSANIIKNLAKGYILKGVVKYEDLMKNLQEDAPLLSKRNIWDALAGRFKTVEKQVESNLTKQMRTLSTISKLEGDIEDAVKGMLEPAPRKEKRKPNEIVETLKKRLANILSKTEQVAMTEAEKEALNIKINEVYDLIEAKFPFQKKVKKFVAEDVKKLKSKLADARAILRANQRSGIYQKMIEGIKEKGKTFDLAGELEKAGLPLNLKAEKTMKSEQREAAEVQLMHMKREMFRAQAALQPITLKSITMEAIDLQRNIRATMDFSYLLRQGGITALTNPKVAMKAAKDAFRGTFNQYTADALNNAIKKDPVYYKMKAAKLALMDIGMGDERSVEFFRGTWSESKVAAWLGIRGITRASERNMTVGLNMVRVGEFKEYLKKTPGATAEELRDVAKMINWHTGAGNANWAGPAGRAFMFSPKFTSSRFQTLASPALMQTEKGRIYASKVLGKYAAVMTSAVTTGHLIGEITGSCSVGINPLDSDFMKIRVGDDVYDFTSGMAPNIRLVFKAIAALYFSATLEPEKAPDIVNEIGRYMKYKAMPTVSTLYQVLYRKNLLNQKLEWYDIVLGSMFPMIIENFVQSVIDDSSPFSMAAGTLTELTGGSAQKYLKKGKTKSRSKKRRWL